MNKLNEFFKIILCILFTNIADSLRNALCGGENCEELFENYLVCLESALNFAKF